MHARPWLIINLCESDTADEIEIIHFSFAEIKVIFPAFERRPVEISALDINVCVC